jgi:hypothetical protein
MKILLIESCEKVIKDEFSSIVHVRNSVIIKNYLECDLISHQSEIDAVKNNKYDVIICAYGSPYMKYNSYLEILDNNKNAKIFWLVNDHDVEDNILLRKFVIKHEKQYNMICNNPREGYRGWILRKNIHNKKLDDWIKDWHTINLNAIIFDENVYEKTLGNKDKQNIIYYGTFRKHRIKDMLDYNNSGYYLSSSKKNHEKYTEAGINANFIEKINWAEKEVDLFNFAGLSLKDFFISLYFEDAHTHENFAFMANRFYEGVMHNTLMVYDFNCQQTIEKSGYEIHPMQIVKNGKELLNIAENLAHDKILYKELMSVQQSNAHKIIKERNSVLNILKEIVYGHIQSRVEKNLCSSPIMQVETGMGLAEV